MLQVHNNIKQADFKRMQSYKFSHNLRVLTNKIINNFTHKLRVGMIKTEFQNEVVNRIRQLRMDHDISQMKLANIIDVSNGQIGNIESPRFQHKYTLRHLYIIARFFNVSICYLLTGNTEELNTDSLLQILIRYDE